jgi:hypothetical protein
MSAPKSVIRDERTVVVENISYRWAFNFISFALLIDVMCRAAFFHEAAWDLMALACVPALVCAMYQARQKILGKRWIRDAVLIACLGGVVGFVIAAILMMTKAMR